MACDPGECAAAGIAPVGSRPCTRASEARAVAPAGGLEGRASELNFAGNTPPTLSLTTRPPDTLRHPLFLHSHPTAHASDTVRLAHTSSPTTTSKARATSTPYGPRTPAERQTQNDHRSPHVLQPSTIPREGEHHLDTTVEPSIERSTRRPVHAVRDGPATPPALLTAKARRGWCSN